MRLHTVVALAAFTGLASAAVTNSTECVDVHFILARGTTKSYPGSLYSLFELVAENTTLTTNYENIVYPAVSETESNSYFIGRTAAARQINHYAALCPDTKVALVSYSQGALIVGDVLAGGGGNSILGNATEPLVSKEVSEKIVANLFYGNPRHTAKQPYNKGRNSTDVTGKYPRLDYQVRNFDASYGDITADWCTNGDGVCSPSAGSNALTLHSSYTTFYNAEAASWLLKRIVG